MQLAMSGVEMKLITKGNQLCLVKFLAISFKFSFLRDGSGDPDPCLQSCSQQVLKASAMLCLRWEFCHKEGG
jgi:hypothetical protein